MCLNVKKEYPKQEDGSIRYKVLEQRNFDGKQYYLSPYRYKEYDLKKTYIKRKNNEKVDAQGFHVYVNKKTARNRSNRFTDFVVVKCRCKGFVAGGTWGSCRIKSEIWRQITLLEEVK